MRKGQNKYYFESFKYEYHRASKKRKGEILDRICKESGYDRKYVTRSLRKRKPGEKKARKRRGRKSQYDCSEFQKALRKLWILTEQMCSKLLKEAIPDWLPAYEKHYGELDKEIREKLLRISPRTIDRVLAKTKAKLGKGKSGTRPGTMLRNQIPVSTICWDTTMPGFVEADTVAHCGGNLSGNFINSLTIVDIATTWTEVRAIWNKGAAATLEQIQDAEESFPFEFLGFDCDNGSEFLNNHLLRYFTDPKTNKLRLAFTRSRAYRKNDQAHVEQKNWSHVRQLLGYQRLGYQELAPMINSLCRNEYSLLRNHFYPSFKVSQKIMVKTRHRRIYGTPITPYQRVLESEHVPDDTKRRLHDLHKTLDPIDLRNRMERKLKNIFSLLKKLKKKHESFRVA